MAWTAPRTWVAGEVVTAAMMNANVRDNPADLDRRTKPQSATVATSQTTTSTTFTDLATAGPAVSVVTGTECLVVVSARLRSNTAATNVYMGVAVSGATTLAASTDKALIYDSGDAARMSAAIYVTGLTAGTNTFTAKYRTDSGATGTFSDRQIVAIPLGAA